MDVSVELGNPIKLSREVEAVLYQVASEGLSNALRHGKPTRVSLSLIPGGDRITLQVVDNGNGFDMGAMAHGGDGFGLFAVKERASLVDGTFTVESAPGKGTRVTVSVPLAGDA